MKGEVEVKIISRDDSNMQAHTFHEGDCFLVLPNEQHYMRFCRETTLVVLYTHPFDEQHPDVLVDRNLPSLSEVYNKNNSRITNGKRNRT